MTASSMEIFPCRIPPIGMLRQHHVASASSMLPTLQPPSPPTPQARRSVSRNLFGATQSSDINQQLREETQSKCNYFQERYQIDLRHAAIQALPAANYKQQQPRIVAASDDNGIAAMKPLPDLIAQEQEQHIQRQLAAAAADVATITKCNSTQAAMRGTEITPPHQIAKTRLTLSSSTIKRTVCPNSAASRCPSASKCSKQEASTGESAGETSASHEHDGSNCSSNERIKPSTRQTLLTDKFNLRKNVLPHNGRQALTAHVRRQLPQQQQQHITDLPQAMRATTSLSTATALCSSNVPNQSSNITSSNAAADSSQASSLACAAKAAAILISNSSSCDNSSSGISSCSSSDSDVSSSTSTTTTAQA